MAVQPYKGGQVTSWDASSVSDNEQDSAIVDAQAAELAEAADVTYAPEEPDSPGGYASQTMEYFGYVKAKYKDTAHTAIDQCNRLQRKCTRLEKQAEHSSKKLNAVTQAFIEQQQEIVEQQRQFAEQEERLAAEKAEMRKLKKENGEMRIERKIHTAVLAVEVASTGGGMFSGVWSWLRS